jgi:AraC-like DNA-binding protein
MISGFRKAGGKSFIPGIREIYLFFSETGATAFIREPLHLLFGQSIPLDCLTGFRDLSEVTGRLCEAACHKERILVVERFLMGRLILPKPDLAITEALLRIRMAKGNLRISDLSDSLCTSIDPFEKKFRKIVGLTPKQYAGSSGCTRSLTADPGQGKCRSCAGSRLFRSGSLQPRL